MPSIAKNTAVLSASRLTNNLITVITPLILVRLLDVEQFGQYREFLLYTMLFSNLVVFGANRSLTYFIPKDPSREGIYLTQSVSVVVVFTIGALISLAIGHDFFESFTSFNFLVPLILFLVVYANLDFVEMYCVARKRPDIVLYYGVARLLLRVLAVVVTAYLTRNVVAIIYATILAEAMRFALVLAISLNKGLFQFRSITRDTIIEQWLYLWPLGLSSVLIDLGQRATNILVSTLMGPAALAFYSAGSYQRPIVRVLRGALADAIFPDMVARGAAKSGKQLSLWQRSTVIYFLLIAPIAALLVINADLIIRLLFTSKFLDAVPIFQIYSASLILFCFEFDLPVRAVGVTKYFLRISWMGLIIRVILVWLAYRALGFPGPALAAIAAQLVTIGYLARKCVLVVGVSLGNLLPWSQLGRIVVLGTVCLAVFPLVHQAIANEMVAAAIASLTYIVAYIGTGRLVGIVEMEILIRRVLRFVNLPG